MKIKATLSLQPQREGVPAPKGKAKAFFFTLFILNSLRLKIIQFYKLLWVDATGFEPATHALQRHCSTN